MTTLKYPSSIGSIQPFSQGKTRDSFRARARDGEHYGHNLRLIVATDRISTHNIVHESTIPQKGQVLNAMTVFWLTQVLGKAGIPHHLVAYGKDIYNYLEGARFRYPEDLHHRAIVVRDFPVLKIEFIFRAYMSGSLWDKYYSRGKKNPYGIQLKPGIQLMEQFPVPIFTPTEKSETDDPIDSAGTAKLYENATKLAEHSFKIIRHHLKNCNITMIDSKFEVGTDSRGKPVLVDEIATPDSSRFCETKAIKMGQMPSWLDKQRARDEAERIWNGGTKVPLTFSLETIDNLTATYLNIFKRITGRSLEEFQDQYLN